MDVKTIFENAMKQDEQFHEFVKEAANDHKKFRETCMKLAEEISKKKEPTETELEFVKGFAKEMINSLIGSTIIRR